ncbi:MAG: L-alanine-DL-glutamate epimerase, partial [Clostridia bacterium]
MNKIKIKKTAVSYIPEKLINPFGFKGKYISELWQTVVLIQSENFTAIMPSTQSVLWSDSAVFNSCLPEESNALMLDVTKKALQMIENATFSRPDILLDEILKDLSDYADKLCGRTVRRTFVLNSLVGIDCALWSIFANENGITDFDGIIPDYAQKALSFRHLSLAHIPLISYGVTAQHLKSILQDGTALLKIKIGACVDKSSHSADMKSMLEQDKKRISEIHDIAKNYSTPLTKSGKICYYLDANGRYESLSQLESLLDYADKIGCLQDISLLEEPFDEQNDIDVSSLPIAVNADESAHSLEDVKKKIFLGYKAVALKPIAKTLSISFKMQAAIDAECGQSLSADLTVNPL